MSQSAPGWYQDHDDPQLARWWDGDRWSEHTLVLDEQDWSTEPAPPTRGDTRFPAPGFDDSAVEAESATGFEEDIYAPIQDPWGQPEPEDPTSVIDADDDDVWAGGGATAVVASPAWDTSPAWDDGGSHTEWAAESPRRRTVADLPRWARIALPLALLALILLILGLAGALGGGNDATTTTSSTTSEPVSSLGDAAQRALLAAGDGPFTLSTFTSLIPLTCDAAANNTPDDLTERIVLLGYDAGTVSQLIDGLDAGTAEYCPDDMAKSPTMLTAVETAAITAATTSTTAAGGEVTVPDSNPTTTTKKPTTATTKKPTATTKPPVTTAPTTTAPTTTAPTTPAPPDTTPPTTPPTTPSTV